MTRNTDRLWLWKKQGLDGSLAGCTGSGVLEETGWARSVGGVNPYLTIFSRAKIEYPVIESDAQRLELYELPSARGCTYVVPSSHFGLALSAAQGTVDESPLKMATRFLGVTPAEIERLQSGILEALKSGPMKPDQLKKSLGGLVRNLGEQGKKRGQSTTLSLGLAPLQVQGKILRVPIGGGFITQHYAYRLWDDGPSIINRDQALVELAKLYFKWCGPTDIKGFQWFSGVGVNACKQAVATAGVASLDDGRLILAEEKDDFLSFDPRPTGDVKFVGSIDNINHLRQRIQDLIDEDDKDLVVPTGSKPAVLGGLREFYSHMIVCDGRIIGMWEYDVPRNEIAYCTWSDLGSATESAAKMTEEMLREHLGDARSFSLDSPASRVSRIELIRSIGQA